MNAAFRALSGVASIPEALRGAVVAIGNFDGCHRGHQAVFEHARALAVAQGGAPTVMLTFEPHPRDVFAPAPFLHRLTGPAEKARIAQALGLDGIVVMPFDRDLAGLAPEIFIQSILVDALSVSGVVAGADFHFGRARAGTPSYLAAQGAARGFAVRILDMLDDGGTHVSSTAIREALAQGRVPDANRLLGYHHFFSGVVEGGDRRGRELGYPTANITVPATTGLRQGVYASRVRLGAEVFDAVSAYGKPMFGDTPPPFETHIFDFDRDIYGETLEIALLDFLRGQIRFDSLEALIAQMDRDSETARITIARSAPLSQLDADLGFVLG